MSSPIVIVTAVESGLGFLLTSTILVLVLTRGKKSYHYLFAAFLLICAIWDLGTFLLMVRNEHLEELGRIGYIIGFWCVFIPALIFHFANLYTGRPIKWAIGLAWGMCWILWLLSFAGLYWNIQGVYTYNWGNIFRVVPSVLDPWDSVAWFVINLSACWLLFRAAKRATSRLEQRHYRYVAIGCLVITFAIVKVGITIGINIPILLPLGMFLVDVFNAIIGLAIIKDRLFDITVIIKKSAIYSALAAMAIFVFSFSEHILITYFGKLMGGHSEIIDLVSIAIGIVALMPIKRRVEHGIDQYFAQRIVEF